MRRLLLLDDSAFHFGDVEVLQMLTQVEFRHNREEKRSKSNNFPTFFFFFMNAFPRFYRLIGILPLEFNRLLLDEEAFLEIEKVYRVFICLHFTLLFFFVYFWSLVALKNDLF